MKVCHSLYGTRINFASGVARISEQRNAVGREAIEGLRFLASLPRAGAGREKTQPFNWIHSRLFTLTASIFL